MGTSICDSASRVFPIASSITPTCLRNGRNYLAAAVIEARWWTAILARSGKVRVWYLSRSSSPLITKFHSSPAAWLPAKIRNRGCTDQICDEDQNTMASSAGRFTRTMVAASVWRFGNDTARGKFPETQGSLEGGSECLCCFCSLNRGSSEAHGCIVDLSRDSKRLERRSSWRS